MMPAEQLKGASIGLMNPTYYFVAEKPEGLVDQLKAWLGGSILLENRWQARPSSAVFGSATSCLRCRPFRHFQTRGADVQGQDVLPRCEGYLACVLRVLSDFSAEESQRLLEYKLP